MSGKHISYLESTVSIYTTTFPVFLTNTGTWALTEPREPELIGIVVRVKIVRIKRVGVGETLGTGWEDIDYQSLLNSEVHSGHFVVLGASSL